MRRSIWNERGQGSVELLLTLPLIVFVMFVGWQIVVAGHTWWKLAEVARLVARERYVADQRGELKAGERRGREIADTLLASSPRASRRISSSKAGRVIVRARVPLVPPFRVVLGPAAGPLLTSSSRMTP
ncbi:MAG: pilus assembly protein [Thermoleophilaceae bacterium]|nr:pilus assembly protein [Thermoleophilaceae bacterium]